LLGDLATQAGVVLHNVRLTLELEAGLAQISSQAEQLRTSRDRIVRARDEERRRLEETIRRSTEQQLIQIRSELAATVMELTVEPDTAVRSLQRMTKATTAVLEELRELARGIYPPVLESQGLAAALKSHVSRLGAVVEVESDAVDRYPSEIEAAIYFCCVEALRGVAGPAAVGLRGRGAGVDFSITGCGPLDGRLLRIEDRVEALGGTVQFDGNRLVGSIPIDQFFFAAAQAAVSRSGSNLALEM
jgi:signal transduction histidine kinase